MSNKTLLYTSSLLPIVWIFFLWLAHTPGWVFLHLQLASKQPRRLPGLSVFPSYLKAFLKISNQVPSCHCPQNRSHLAAILDTCKNGLCPVLFTSSWAWDTRASKWCTCLHKRRWNTCSSHILGPNLCALWDCVSLCDLSSPISLLFMDFIYHPSTVSFFSVMHTTQISPEHLSDKDTCTSLALSRLKCLSSLFTFHAMLPVLRSAPSFVNPQ